MEISNRHFTRNISRLDRAFPAIQPLYAQDWANLNRFRKQNEALGEPDNRREGGLSLWGIP